MPGPMCVVIAEDNQALRKVIVDYLAAFGIMSIEARTESEAWSALMTRQVDVLVLDMILSSTWLVLPFLQRMRQEPSIRSIPVIVTTAFEIDTLRSSDGGNYLEECSILEKPYDLCRLRRTIIKASARNPQSPTVHVS